MRILARALLVVCFGCAAAVHAQNADSLLRDAKLAMFEEKWETALEKVRLLRDDFPGSPLRAQAFFYEAKILEALDRKEEALVTYESYLAMAEGSSPLAHEATYAVAALGVELYSKGQTGYINRTLDALSSKDRELRFFAALQLSYVDDRRVNRRAVPVLKETLAAAEDREVRNQATLALLRIDPNLLDQSRQDQKRSKGTQLQLVILENNEEVFKLSLPLSLARLLFSSLPEDAKEELLDQGINPENLLDQLEKGHDIIEVRTPTEVIRLSIR